MRRPSPGTVFVVALLVLVVTLFANFMYASEAVTRNTSGGVTANAERAVDRDSIVVMPGDRVVFRAAAFGLPVLAYEQFDAYEVYVVPSGEYEALLRGEEPSRVYMHLDGFTTQSCCPYGMVQFDRPATDDVGDATRKDARRDLDTPARLEVVRVFEWREGAAPEDERNATRAAQLALQHPAAAREDIPAVIRGDVVRAQPWLYAFETLVALVAIGGAVAWARAMWRNTAAATERGAGALVEAYTRAGESLAAVRDILLGGALLLFLVLLHAFAEGEPGGLLGSATHANLAPIGEAILRGALVALYLVVGGLWVAIVVRAQLAVRRWRRRMDEDPLDLA